MVAVDSHRTRRGGKPIFVTLAQSNRLRKVVALLLVIVYLSINWHFSYYSSTPYDGTLIQDSTSVHRQHNETQSVLGPGAKKYGTPNSPYAYVFLLTPVKLENSQYKKYLYGIYVSSYLLRKFGSTADIVVFLQFYYDSSTALPQKELDLLQALNITVRILPRRSPRRVELFPYLNLNKLRILTLTEYRRVLFLDADVMPIANMDVLFHMSDPQSGVELSPRLQENFVVQGHFCPYNGGVFMLTPHAGDIRRIQELVQKRLTQVEPSLSDGQVPLNGPDTTVADLFNMTVGWGRPLPPAGWEGIRKRGKHWNFFYSSLDQGLLYHWVKLEQQQLSLLMLNGSVVNYVPNDGHPSLPKSDVVKVESMIDPFPSRPAPPASHRHDPLFLDPSICWELCVDDPHTRYPCWEKMCSGAWTYFVHFFGKLKPWYTGYPADLNKTTAASSAIHFWFTAFDEFNAKYKAEIDVNSISKVGVGGLGAGTKEFHVSPPRMRPDGSIEEDEPLASILDMLD